MKVTVHVKYDFKTGNSSVAVHVGALPPIPKPPVRVETRTISREDAAIKSSQWVSARKDLESLMYAADVADGCGSINEFLLCETVASTSRATISANDDKQQQEQPYRGDAMILEGSQTNFFAVIDGALHTASTNDGKILSGTIRQMVIQVCQREGIKVVFQTPTLRDAQQKWQGALISSTSRLLLPVDEIYSPIDGKVSEKGDLLRTFSYKRKEQHDDCCFTIRLSRLVAAEVEANSELIVGM